MTRTRTVGLWAVAVLAAPALAGEVKAKAEARAPAPADCAGTADRGMFDGPVAVGFFDVDYGTGRRACGRTEVGLGLLGGATIDTPDFYGALGGGAELYGSYLLPSMPLEVFGALELVKVQYVQNASLKGTSFSLGQATVGATYGLLRSGALVVAPSARLMLPTDTSMPDVRTVGVELGGAASWRPWAPLELHGYLGGDLSAGLSYGPALVRPGLLVSVGAQWSPFRWGGVVLDLNGHLGQAMFFAPAIGLRAVVAKAWGIELAGTLPLAGTIRNDAAFGLKVAYRL